MPRSCLWWRRILTFPAHQTGVAFIEFALVFPLLMLLLIGCVEITRMITIHQRVTKIAFMVSDVVSQYPPSTAAHAAPEISQTKLEHEILNRIGRMMAPYDDDARQAVILTSLRKESGVVKVKWQVGGGGTLNAAGAASIVNGGVLWGLATTPDSAVNASFAAQLTSMPDGENMLVGEVFYRYTPLWDALIGGVGNAFGQNYAFATPAIVTKRMFFRPRQGDLICLPPNFSYTECS